MCKVRCAPLQLAGKDITYVSELKYLGIHVIAARQLKFSVDHLRVKFYRMFNCIYSKSKAANSEMVTVELLKSYCLPFMLNAVEAVSLSSENIRILENCINRAMFRIFGISDRSSLEYLKSCVNIKSMKELIERKRCNFIDCLLCDVRFSELLLVYNWNSCFFLFLCVICECIYCDYDYF